MSIRVLIVTDNEGSFGAAEKHRFSMTELIKALKEADCIVTTAHRSPEKSDSYSEYAATAAKRAFVFTNDLPYDEVWLMGFGAGSTYQLKQAEVDALITFMNAGGGLFATGDHEVLGSALCGKVPRVETMRHWLSPSVSGPSRLDTTRRGHDTHYEFQDQSDDVPQVIHPVVTYNFKIENGKTVLYAVAHPLLTVPRTTHIISVMPDHMHEGMCKLPADPARKYKLGNATLDEYPVKDGVRVLPEVVARSVVNARKAEEGYTDPDTQGRDANADVNAAVFPSIVAYRGQLVGVGNVVTDASFHHFVNINVTGVKSGFYTEPDANEGVPEGKKDATKENGFPSSPVGQAHYELIKTYWRNIARWIARPGVV